jgi:hypothetical protein
MTYYRQCVLTKGPTSEVAFIPEKFAVDGKYLRIGDDNGWQVREVGKNRTSGEYLQEYTERAHLNHRKVTYDFDERKFRNGSAEVRGASVG